MKQEKLIAVYFGNKEFSYPLYEELAMSNLDFPFYSLTNSRAVKTLKQKYNIAEYKTDGVLILRD